MHSIYFIVNTTTDRVYVGQSVGWKHRVRNHFYQLTKGNHHCQHLQRSFDKYGRGAFEFFASSDSLTKEEADDAERFYIAWFRSLGLSYNSTGGGDGCYSPSDELKARLSDVRRGKIRTEEAKRKTSESLKGRQTTPMTPETRAKISATLTGRTTVPCSEDKKAKISAANTGRTFTPEQVENVRLGAKAGWDKRRADGTDIVGDMPEETKRKISESRKGKGTGPRSEETRAKLSDAATKRYAGNHTHGTEWAYYGRGCRCEVCCAAIVKPKTEKEVVINHGTRWAYEHHGCRCSVCVEAKKKSRKP